MHTQCLQKIHGKCLLPKKRTMHDLEKPFCIRTKLPFNSVFLWYFEVPSYTTSSSIFPSHLTSSFCGFHFLGIFSSQPCPAVDSRGGKFSLAAKEMHMLGGTWKNLLSSHILATSWQSCGRLKPMSQKSPKLADHGDQVFQWIFFTFQKRLFGSYIMSLELQAKFLFLKCLYKLSWFLTQQNMNYIPELIL